MKAIALWEYYGDFRYKFAIDEFTNCLDRNPFIPVLASSFEYLLAATFRRKSYANNIIIGNIILSWAIVNRKSYLQALFWDGVLFAARTQIAKIKARVPKIPNI